MSVNQFHPVILQISFSYLLNKIRYRSDIHSLNLRFCDRISSSLHYTAFSGAYNVYTIYNVNPDYPKEMF